MIDKKPAADGEHILVTFHWRGTPWVGRVNLVGTFNDWNTAETAMVQDAETLMWSVSLELPAGQQYEFRYLIDGTEWQNDWHADTYMPNTFGSENSVIVL